MYVYISFVLTCTCTWHFTCICKHIILIYMYVHVYVYTVLQYNLQKGNTYFIVSCTMYVQYLSYTPPLPSPTPTHTLLLTIVTFKILHTCTNVHCVHPPWGPSTDDKVEHFGGPVQPPTEDPPSNAPSGVGFQPQLGRPP